MEHKHKMATKYVLEPEDNKRPNWAQSYKGPKRWLIIDYCENCTYSSARDVTTNPPTPRKRR